MRIPNSIKKSVLHLPKNTELNYISGNAYFLIVISKWAYLELYPFHISLDCVFVYPSMPKVVGWGCFNKCPRNLNFYEGVRK